MRNSPVGESISWASPSLTSRGETAACFEKNDSRSTTRSLTIGKLSIGWTVIVGDPRSLTCVSHASLGLPLTFIPHEPQDAILHENRIATPWSSRNFT